MRPMLRNVCIALTALVAGLPAATAPAVAQATQPPGALSVGLPQGSSDADVQVASDTAGDVTAVWIERAGGATAIRASTRPGGGDWSASETVASGLTAVADTEAEPRPIRLVVDAGGTAHLLWSLREKANGVPHSLRVTSRPPGGPWQPDHVVADAAPAAGIGLESDLAVAADGTLIVLWSSATHAPSEYEIKGLLPGVAYASERSPAGVWGGAQPLGAAYGVTAAPQLGVNHSGAAVAIWASPKTADPFEGGPLNYANRSTAGGWTAGDPAAKLETGGYGSPPPLLDERGRTHVLSADAGNYGIAGVSHRLIGPGIAPAKPVTVPRPSKRQSRSGWLGTGYVSTIGAVVDARGQLVVLTGNDSPGVESGGFGTGALWAATRDEAGHWTVVAVDALAESSGARNADLSTDPSGQLVATWAVDTDGGGCGSVVYRSVRAADGTWSPRVTVGAGGAGTPPYDPSPGFGPCPAVVAHVAGGGSPAAWWVEGANRLVVAPEPTGAVPRAAAVAFSPTLLTRTWRDVRRAGGIAFRCPIVSGYCSASVVGELARPRKVRRPARGLPAQPTPVVRALGCLSLRSTDPVAAEAPGGAIVTLERPGRCARDWVPPTMSFTVLVTGDALGQPSAGTRVRITIRR